jgi:hypothetical protein
LRTSGARPLIALSTGLTAKGAARLTVFSFPSFFILCGNACSSISGACAKRLLSAERCCAATYMPQQFSPCMLGGRSGGAGLLAVGMSRMQRAASALHAFRFHQGPSNARSTMQRLHTHAYRLHARLHIAAAFSGCVLSFCVSLTRVLSGRFVLRWCVTDGPVLGGACALRGLASTPALSEASLLHQVRT